MTRRPVPRSAPRIVHRASICRCRRFWKSFPRSASRSVHRASMSQILETVLQERISERTQIDAPVPRIVGEPVAPVPQLQKETVEVRISDKLKERENAARKERALVLKTQGNEAFQAQDWTAAAKAMAGEAAEVEVACPKCGCLTTCVEDDACDECREYGHIRECAACVWYACTRCTEAAQAARLPREARRRRGRGRHWW